MRLPTSIALLLCSSVALAKPWQGIEPGASKRDDVTKKFGEPSKVVAGQGKETLAYLSKQAIKGTSQAHFQIDSATKVVTRIDVFPGVKVEKETIEATYGPVCPPAGAKVIPDPCYVKKVTDDFRTYFFYATLNVAVFLGEDGKTVASMVFTVPKPKTPPPG